MFGRSGIWHRWKLLPNASAALQLILKNRKAAADLRRIADDISVRGVSPVSLRNRVLQAVTLSGQYIEKKGHHWRYFTPMRRRVIAYLFVHRAAQLAKRGKMKFATRYVKSWIFLQAQDDIVFSPMNWLDLNAREAEKMGLPRSIARKFSLYYRRDYSTLKVWSHHVYELLRLRSRLVKLSSPVPLWAAQKYIHLMLTTLRTEHGDIGYEYRTLLTVDDDLRQIRKAGHQGLSKKKELALEQWSAKIKSDRTLPKLERSALLRWIKEASI